MEKIKEKERVENEIKEENMCPFFSISSSDLNLSLIVLISLNNKKKYEKYKNEILYCICVQLKQ